MSGRELQGIGKKILETRASRRRRERLYKKHSKVINKSKKEN